MIQITRERSGIAALEYMGFFLVILGLFILSGQFAQNSIQGYFRKSSDNLSFMRQHDPRRTRDCIWDPQLEVWYAEKCLEYYSRTVTSVGADDMTTTTCAQNLTPSACSNPAFSTTCPTTCNRASYKTGTCHLPCAFLAAP